MDLTHFVPVSMGEAAVEVQRRHLLSAALSTSGLVPGGGPGPLDLDLLDPDVLDAADRTRSALETETSTGRALGAAEVRLLELGVAHMAQHPNPLYVQTQAATVLRDAATIRHGGTAELFGPALYVEALAAALAALVYGENGDWPMAYPLFVRAEASALHAAEVGESRGSHALALIRLMRAKVVLYTRPGCEVDAERLATEAWQMAMAPKYGAPPHTGPAHALAPALIARARALRGDAEGARAALDDASSWIGGGDYSAGMIRLKEQPYGCLAPMTAFGYGLRAHDFTMAEVFGLLGDVESFRAARHRYLDGHPDLGPATTVSARTLALGEAWCVGVVGRIDEAADMAYRALDVMPACERTAPVLTRAALLCSRLTRPGAVPPRAVDRLGGLLSRYRAPLAAPVDV